MDTVTTRADGAFGSTLRRALHDAASWHFGQVRKGTEVPYVSHLLAVCAAVMDEGGSEDEAIAEIGRAHV